MVEADFNQYGAAIFAVLIVLECRFGTSQMFCSPLSNYSISLSLLVRSILDRMKNCHLFLPLQ